MFKMHLFTIFLQSINFASSNDYKTKSLCYNLFFYQNATHRSSTNFFFYRIISCKQGSIQWDSPLISMQRLKFVTILTLYLNIQLLL